MTDDSRADRRPSSTDALTAFRERFGAPRALIGVLHVGALPGTPSAFHSIDTLIRHTLAEARIYRDAGFTALTIENMHDRPYLKGGVGPEITAAMTALAREVKRETGLLIGIQVREPFVSVDPHLAVTEQTLPDWREMLADVDAFFPGEDELLLDGVQTNPERVLAGLGSGRLRFVVFKRGAEGGILYDARSERFHTWTARANRVVDPTGAGDTFSVGFILAHLEGLPLEVCLQRAVATASFAVEGWGADALLAATTADADSRWRRWYGREIGP